MFWLHLHFRERLFLLTALIALVASAGIVVERRFAALRMESRLTKARKEFRGLSQTVPAPTAENAILIQWERDHVQQNVAAWRSELTASGSALNGEWKRGAPAKRTDAYFDLAALVETLKQSAAESGVTLKADERFGFALYAHEGPEAELIRTVFQQRVAVDYLTSALFRGRPDRLLSVQRERPTPAENRRKGKAGADVGSRDFFLPDLRSSLRAPRYIRTQSYRLMFAGKTASLRSFLNEINGFALPMVVRSVEVQPADPLEPNSKGAKETPPRLGPESDSDGAVVTPSTLVFTVVVEWVEVDEFSVSSQPRANGSSSE